MLVPSEIKERIAQTIPQDLVTPEHDHMGHHYRYKKNNKVYDSVTTKAGILDMPHLKKWAANQSVEYLDRNWDRITRENKSDHYKAAILAHEDVLKDAGNVGTQGHEAVERYITEWLETDKRPADIRDFIIGEDSRLWAITRSAEVFMSDFEFMPIATELFVVSEKYEYAGQVDCIAIILKEMNPGEGACKHDYKVFRQKHYRCSACMRVVTPLLSIVDWKTSNSVDKPEYAMQVAAYYYAFREMTGIKPDQCVIVQLDKHKAKYNVVRIQDPISAFRTFNHVGKVYGWLNDGVTKLYPYTPKDEIYI
jgi:hypothetical protein